ncbi:GNAT family N-acetyltransferase [Plantactinospora sp. GCM10030261]|uniref:GNAT family N-acetyltransferase n=1 Tax=Plantactinospora sp. GCM10030261 TaxID=3273420 RepID=UPI00360DE133
MLDIHDVDPHDEDALRNWYIALHAGATADRPAALVTDWPTMRRRLRRDGPHHRWLAVAAVSAGRTVGALLVGLPLTENRTTIDIEIDVPPEHRCRGVGTALWGRAVEIAAAERRTVAQREIDVPAGHTTRSWPGTRFAERLGFTSKHVEDHLALPLPADDGLLDRLAEAAAERAGEYRLTRWAGPCPEEHLAGFSRMLTAMSGDVPSGDLTRDQVVWDVERIRARDSRLAESYRELVAVAHDATGEPAGYSIIDVPHDDPANVLQDDTFVFAAHRGHRLGTALKVANLRQLARHRGDRHRLHTWTAKSNTAMQAVNARFGFRPVETTHAYERTMPPADGG